MNHEVPHVVYVNDDGSLAAVGGGFGGVFKKLAGVVKKVVDIPIGLATGILGTVSMGVGKLAGDDKKQGASAPEGPSPEELAAKASADQTAALLKQQAAQLAAAQQQSAALDQAIALNEAQAKTAAQKKNTLLIGGLALAGLAGVFILSRRRK
jgi:LPXTG-motif cell wall-anchored protein